MTLTIHDGPTLHNGIVMPWLGLGVFKVPDGEQVENAVKAAVELGYRSIDTAAIYNNEAGVGRAVRQCGVPRDQLFVTTKLWNADQGHDSGLRAFDASLERLGMDYVDLYLIHWPVKGKYKDSWRALEKTYADGRARAIGVSNFLVHHLEDVMADAKVMPMANQVEFHPRLVQPQLLGFCNRHRIQLEAWSPLMQGRVFDIPELGQIAQAHGRTISQVVLRWNIQKGVVTIPKSVHRERIAENAGIFEFHLSDDEMKRIDALDANQRIGPDPDHVDF